MEGTGKQYVPLAQRLGLLLDLAARRLKLGGRLVFLLPLPADAAPGDALPHSAFSGRFELEALARRFGAPCTDWLERWTS